MPRTDDPRTHITPASFAVAPELIGVPLAGPWRRLFAFLADLVPVAVLANAGLFVFLAFTAAVLVWRALSARENRRVNAFVRFAASLAALVMVLKVGGVFTSDAGSFEQEISQDSVNQIVQNALASSGADPDANVIPPDFDPTASEPDDEPRGIMGWLRVLIVEDLGIGFGWGALYFTTFLVLGRGQTPGKRLLGVRVIRLDARPIGWWLAFERFGSYFASVSTGLFGFAQIFWDRNRQALHDKAVETVVVRVRRGDHSVARQWNAAQSPSGRTAGLAGDRESWTRTE